MHHPQPTGFAVLLKCLTEFGFECEEFQTPPLTSPYIAGPCVSPASLTVAPPVPSIFSHVRNLSGIVGSLTWEPVPDNMPLPFFGHLAMAYLQSHGYNIPSVLHVFSTFQSTSTAEEFAAVLARKGLPLTEGNFLWHLIDFARANDDKHVV